MRVLVIPEDFRKDQYVLKPILTAMFNAAGRPRAIIEVCMDPLLQGVSRALDWAEIESILDRYPMVDLFLLVVDRDGQAGRRQQLNSIENNAGRKLAAGRLLLAENCWQELEVWVLAGHDLPAAWNWADIRQEPNSKELFFLPFARERGLLDEPGQGRKTLANAAASRYNRVRQLCTGRGRT